MTTARGMTAGRVLLLLFLLGLLVAVALGAQRAQRMGGSATALAARQVCALHLAAGLPLERALSSYVNHQISPVSSWLEVKVIPEAVAGNAAGAVTASLRGWLPAKAVHRPGFGCTLVHNQALADLPQRVRVSAPNINVARKVRSANFRRKQLARALDDAFTEPDPDALRQTLAIMVLHEGKLVAEAYAPGIEQATPLPGFSMAKSMTATLIGLLVQHKGLSVDEVIPDAGPLTAAGVTINQLLRMTSGLDLVEDGSGFDPNSIMLMHEDDAAQYAQERGLGHTPGEHYAYSGGGPILLARLFKQIAGDNEPIKAFEFLRQHLLKPMRLQSVQLEHDATGTFLGSSFMLASTLDWAKLGQLYLQDGVWRGERLLPEGWTAYVSRTTKRSGAKNYGAGFWTATTGGRDAQHAELPLLPGDAFFMHGMMNQAVFVLPSQSLVIVRLGATRRYLQSGEWQLVADVVASMREVARAPER